MYEKSHKKSKSPRIKNHATGKIKAVSYQLKVSFRLKDI